jgi:hypothetical protein
MFGVQEDWWENMGRETEYKIRRIVYATLKQYSFTAKDLLPELLPKDNDRTSMDELFKKA